MIAKNFEVSYWPYYCEENIWHLCGHHQLSQQHLKVLFISNSNRSVALWSQRLAPSPNIPVVWDYHVVLLHTGEPAWEIWDLDTSLPLPMPTKVYLQATFRSLRDEDVEYAPRFRLVSALEYRASLATDRRHMLDSVGALQHPAPPWPPIGQGSNLMQFVSMDEPFLGETLDLSELQQLIAGD